MGQEGSIQAPQYTVKDGFDRDQFQRQHNANHIEFALQQLSSIGTDLSKISPKVPLPMAVPHPKILFIICNTYTAEQYKLGSGPLNDSIAVASFLKQLGYTVFYLHNTTSKIFIEWFRHILKNATADLTLFFAGYAITPKEEEANGKNDVIYFDDGYVKDEEISDLLSQCRGPKQRTVLLTDCCHSGTVWDLDSFKKKAPQNVLSISPAKDSEPLDSKDQGIFTFYFWKIWSQNQSITIKQMKEEIATPLSKYNLHLDYYLTTPELADQPIFTKPEEAPNKPAPLLSLKPAAKAESKPAAKAETPAAKTETPATKTETQTSPAPAEKPAVTERTSPTPVETKEEPKPAAPEAPKEEKQEPAPAAKEEAAPAQQEPAAKEQAPAQEPAKEEKSSSDDEDDKSSSDDEDKKDKKEKSSSDDEDKKEKSSSDDEDDKSSSDDEEKKDKKAKSSSDDEDDKSSGDEDDKSD